MILEAQPRTFIGRQLETQDLLGSLDSPLTTIVGPGGVGKTTLVWHAVAVLGEEEFPDGKFVARLASIFDPELVAAEVAASVGLPRTSGLGYERAIVDWLRDRRALLILDNCEQVLDGAAALAEVLTNQLPDLAILATSREALEVEAETVLRLSTLEPTPPGTSAGELAKNEAVALFLERAQSRWPEFEISESQLDAVGEICRSLDGLPLAIELAAARVGALPPSEIASRLKSRLGLLVNRNRLVEERHRTLHSTVDWSFALLRPEEQEVFRRLSVFAGGFDLGAAAAVVSGDHSAEEVEEIIFGLVDKSLLYRPDPELARYRMLEIVRQYAAGKLDGAGEGSLSRDRHSSWYMQKAGEAGAALQSGPERAWLEMLSREHDNIRAALGHMLNGETPELALGLAASLGMFWWTRGHTREGISWTERALEASPQAPPELRAAGLFSLGFLWAHDTDDWSRAAEFLDEGIAIAESAETLESPILGYLLCLRGQAANFAGEHERALGLTRRGTEIIRGAGDPWGTGFGLWNIGFSLRHLGDDEGARRCFEEMAAIQREHGIGLVLMIACKSLAEIAEDRGDHEQALKLYEEALELRRELGAARLGDIHGSLPGGLLAVARTSAILGDSQRANEAASEALPVAEELRDQEAIVEARAILTGEDPAGSGREGVFERQGKIWRTVFEGEEAFVPDSKGMRQLRELIARPGQEIGAVTLSSALDGAGRDLGDAGELLDSQAIDEYGRRLLEIEQEADEAESFNDPERAARLAEEREALTSELARAVGMDGQSRRAGSSVERARINVTRTLRSAIDRILEESPPLGDHLNQTVKTGNFCRYEPAEPISWRL